MKLKVIALTPKNIIEGMDVLREMKSLTAIQVGQLHKHSPDEFWRRYDAGEFK